jgi:hypothetical protein
VLYQLSHTASPFCSGYFRDGGLTFGPAQPGLLFSYFILPAIVDMTGVYHHVQLFSVEMQSVKHFCLEWNHILLILAFKVAGIIDVSHQLLAQILYLYVSLKITLCSKPLPVGTHGICDLDFV